MFTSLLCLFHYCVYITVVFVFSDTFMFTIVVVMFAVVFCIYSYICFCVYLLQLRCICGVSLYCVYDVQYYVYFCSFIFTGMLLCSLM